MGIKQIRLTNAQIEDILNKLNRIKNKDIAIDALTMYQIIKNIKTLEVLIASYVEVKNSLILKFGVANDEGNVSVPEEKKVEFFEEIKPIINEEHDIEIHAINIKSLDGVIFTMDDMLALEIMIEE
ncbi:MAG TPA: hypothetical protein GXZ90_06090 [Clostridiales bacterium]|nr:hypothetical protein [Clostridiales bacterium]